MATVANEALPIGTSASTIAHKADDEGTSLREAALALGVSADDFDRIVDPKTVVGHPQRDLGLDAVNTKDYSLRCAAARAGVGSTPSRRFFTDAWARGRRDDLHTRGRAHVCTARLFDGGGAADR